MSGASDVVRALRRATPAEREQIRRALGVDAPKAARGALQVAADLEAVREVLEGLTELEAVALLSESVLLLPGVTEGELVEKLVPYVDGHWVELEERLGGLSLVCGGVGRRVLEKVVKGVSKARLERGGTEVASALGIVDAARAAVEGKVDAEGIDEVAAELYRELVEGYAAEVSGASGLVFGAFTARDLGLLRSCKRWLRENEPDTYGGDWRRLNVRLAGMFEESKRSGMDPYTRLRRREIKREQRMQPNVLFKGLREGEPAKWGGYLEDRGGRPDDGGELWGGGRDYGEMQRAVRGWMLSRGKGIEVGGIDYLIP